MPEPDQSQPSVEERSFQEKRDARLGIPEGYSLHEPFRNFWPNVASSIAKAEVILALLIHGYGLSIRLSINSVPVFPILDLVATLLMLLLVYYLAMKIVSLAATFVILALNPLFSLLKTDCENIFCGVFAGGTVGLVLSLPFCFFSNLPYPFFLIGFSTIFGQLGGAWGAWKSLSDQQAYEEKISFLPTTFQFGIRQMLLLTLGCAIILTVLKLAGLLTERFLICLALGMAIQLAGMAAVAITNQAKRKSRCERST